MCSLCIRSSFRSVHNVLIRSQIKRWKHKSAKKAQNLSGTDDPPPTPDLALKTLQKQFPRELDLDPKVAKRMEEEGIKTNQHPGIMRLKMVRVPERMEASAHAMSQKYGGKNLKKASEELVRYIDGRHPPMEMSEIDERAREIQQNIIQRENIDMSTLTEQQTAALKNKVVMRLKKTVYHWKPIKYNAFKGMTYMVGRLAQNYSVLLQCLSEIWKRDPDFVPESMYNLGSGIGSAIWAANQVWGKKIKQYYCVDASSDMNTIARLLLQDGEEQQDMHINNVYFKQFEPSSDTNKFPLAISAYTLLDQQEKEARNLMVEKLWDRTSDYLILVENGTSAGYKLIQEARDHIIKTSSESENEDEHGHVFAPCPHDKICPKFQLPTRIPCTFVVKYMPLQIYNAADSSKLEKYSYVILRKGWKNVKQERQWPRLTMEVTTPARHVHCKMCCPDGQFRHVVLTAKKQSKDLYKITRKSSWGDLLPVVWPEDFKEDEKPKGIGLKRMKHLEKQKEKKAALGANAKNSDVLEKSDDLGVGIAQNSKSVGGEQTGVENSIDLDIDIKNSKNVNEEQKDVENAADELQRLNGIGGENKISDLDHSPDTLLIDNTPTSNDSFTNDKLENTEQLCVNEKATLKFER